MWSNEHPTLQCGRLVQFCNLVYLLLPLWLWYENVPPVSWMRLLNWKLFSFETGTKPYASWLQPEMVWFDGDNRWSFGEEYTPRQSQWLAYRVYRHVSKTDDLQCSQSLSRDVQATTAIKIHLTIKTVAHCSKGIFFLISVHFLHKNCLNIDVFLYIQIRTAVSEAKLSHLPA